MSNFIKNLVLLIVVLVLSYFTAEYFGYVYNTFSPLYDRSFFPISEEGLVVIAGIPFAYIFFTTLLFQSFGFGNRNKWTGWLLVPPFLFFASGDLRHIYLPIILGLIAFGLARLIQKVFKGRSVLSN